MIKRGTRQHTLLERTGKERGVRLVVQSLAEAGTPPRSARKSPKAGSTRKSPR
jgi:hypothetical protein